MNRILIVSILLFALQTSADSELKTSKKDKSFQIKSFVESFASLLGALSFGSVAAVISPLILKAGFIPLILISKLISKPLIMIGLTGWLMVALTPTILVRSGMTSPVFESRSQENQMLGSMATLLSTNMSVITTETMNFFDLNNEECKLEMSCRLGKKLASAIPYFQYFVSQSGASNWIEHKYMANVVRSMTDPNDCTNICQSLNGHQKTLSSTTYSTDSSDSLNNVLEWLG